MYRDENKSSVLAKALNPFDYVIIDTCSLMDESFPEWMDALHNAKEYRKKGQCIYVPRRCYEELKKHAKQEQDDSKRIDAKRGLKILRHDRWFTHLLTITKKDKNEHFADNAIYVKVSTDRLFSKILIITQDKKLATDLRLLNSLKSQNGRFLEVCKIVPGGVLEKNLGEPKSNRERKGHSVPMEDHFKPQPKPEAMTDKDILAADQRLSAVLGNGNYPEERKRADVQAQIKALEKLTVAQRGALPLVLSLPALRNYLSTGNLKEAKATKNAEKPAKTATPKPEPLKASVSEAKKLPAEVPAKAEKPQPDRLWYGAGKTFQDALIDVAHHYGILFRDASVTYNAQAHGPFDFGPADYEAIVSAGLAAMKDDLKVAFTYQGIPMWAQKASDDRYKCWIDVSATQVKPVTEEPKPAAKPKKAKPKAEEPKEPVAPKEPKPEEAPAAKKPTKAKKAAKAEPKEDVPAVEEAPKPKAKRVKKEAPKAEEPAKEEPKPETPKAKKTAKAKKPAEPKPEETPAEEKKPAAKKTTAKKSAKPAEEKPAEEKKPAVKKPAAKKATKPKDEAPAESPNLKKAMDADRRLRAVLPNPTYPTESKIADMKAQRDLLMTLTEAEFSKLKYGPKQIDEWLKNNGGQL